MLIAVTRSFELAAGAHRAAALALTPAPRSSGWPPGAGAGAAAESPQQPRPGGLEPASPGRCDRKPGPASPGRCARALRTAQGKPHIRAFRSPAAVVLTRRLARRRPARPYYESRLTPESPESRWLIPSAAEPRGR